jgi:hypothetical protein
VADQLANQALVLMFDWVVSVEPAPLGDLPDRPAEAVLCRPSRRSLG